MKPPIKEGQYLVYLFGNDIQLEALFIAVCNGKYMNDTYCSSDYKLAGYWNYDSSQIQVLGIFDHPVDENYIVTYYPEYFV